MDKQVLTYIRDTFAEYILWLPPERLPQTPFIYIFSQIIVFVNQIILNVTFNSWPTNNNLVSPLVNSNHLCVFQVSIDGRLCCIRYDIIVWSRALLLLLLPPSLLLLLPGRHWRWRRRLRIGEGKTTYRRDVQQQRSETSSEESDKCRSVVCARKRALYRSLEPQYLLE